MTVADFSVTRLRRTLYDARWAGAYLVVAGALIAAAGSEVSSPSPEEHARKIESRVAGELAPLADAAAAVAGSVARERRRLEAERASRLDAALAAARSWLRTAAAGGDPAQALARSASELAPLVPAGVAVAVVGAAGEPLFECGGRVDLDSPEARVEPVSAGPAPGLTLAVSWTEPLTDPVSAARSALSSALSGAAPAGTGLYFVGPEGGLVASIATRPVSAAPLAPTLAARPALEDGPTYLASGDLQTGKLLTIRRACPACGGDPSDASAGWTTVAERFVTPEELAEGAPGGFGMLALTALGLVAAAAFAHAVRSGVLGGGRRSDDVDGRPGRGRSHGRSVSDSRRPERIARAPRPSPAGAAGVDACAEAEPAPTGCSILRLRESLGTPAEGPDIAACARSPILRALSKHVRSPRPVALPREVREWGTRNARGAHPASISSPRKSA